MKTLKSVTTQTKRVELLADETGAIVRVYDYNDETNKYEHTESYGSPYLIDCEINYELEIYSL